MIPDGLLLPNPVGGAYVSLESFPGFTVSDFNGLFSPMARTTDGDIKIPYRDGEIPQPGDFTGYDFPVPFVIGGIVGTSLSTRRASMISQLSGIAALVAPGVFLMRRRLVTGDGTYVEHEAWGKYLNGINPERMNPWNGSGTLNFRNSDGYWRVIGSTTPVFP